MSQKDYKFQWQDWKKCNCVCRIRIFEGASDFAGKKVIIASDCNEGNSVTNEAENIATLICRKENIELSDLVFIEHYGAAGEFDETFDRVEFDRDERKELFTNPRWTYWGKEKTENAIGESLPFVATEKKQEFGLPTNRTLEMKEK